MKKLFLIFVVVCWACVLSNAQSVKLFTIDKELSSSMINQIYQDNDGIIWIATENGLNRYDGAKFTVYKHDKENTNSISSDDIITVKKSSNGVFLIGSLNGLQWFDEEKNEFKSIKLKLSNGISFDAHVTSIYERKNGEILVGTSGHGIFLLKEEENELVAYQQAYSDECKFTNDIQEDVDRNLWIATKDKGLFCIKPDQSYESFYKTANIKGTMSCMCIDSLGNMYVGTYDEGLYIKEKNKFRLLYPKTAITSLFVDGDNKLYIGTDGKGLKTYIYGEKEVEDAQLGVSSFNFSNTKIHSIIKDQKGNMWFGLFQMGVMLVPVNRNYFQYIGYKSVITNVIGHNCVMSLCKDHEKSLWIGTDNDGIYKITDKRTVSHYRDGIPSVIMCMQEDSHHNLWVGSYMEGLGRFNTHTGHYESYRLVDSLGDNINSISCLIEDNQQNLWVGTMGWGLFRIHLPSGQITQYKGEKGDVKKLINNWVNCLYLSRDNKLYIGTYYSMTCMDLDTYDYVLVENKDKNLTNKLLMNAVVFSLYEDKTGKIWAGTSDGLMEWDVNTHEVNKYTTKDGLPSNLICTIKEDINNRLWISTNYGLSCFDRQKFNNYYAGDGLFGNEFSKGAVWIDETGRFIYGGVSGLVFFNPEYIMPSTRELDLYITDMYVHEKAVRRGMMSGHYLIVDTTVSNARVFNLAYTDNSFSIEFTTREFMTPERIVFSYSVNEEEWINLQPGANRLSFSNLSPGVYKFKIRAKDFDIYSPIKEFMVKVYPPWYITWWAIVCYVLLVISIVCYIIRQIRYRSQVRMQLLEQRHAQDINEAKLQFFMNISHEIRTPMSLIISPLKTLISTDRDQNRSKLYNIINRNSDRILRLINQLMDIRKIDNGHMFLKFKEMDVILLLKDAMNVFKYQAQEKNITYTFYSDLQGLKAWIDVKNFDKIIMNLLSNAFKFTPEGGKIDVQVNRGENSRCKNELCNYYEIVVSDNGESIDKDKIERIFDRYYQIVNSQNNSKVGTGIGLHLTRSLVQLHHGKIWAENNVDGLGCRFVVRLPMGNAYLKPEEIVYEESVEIEEEQGVEKEDIEQLSMTRKKFKNTVLVVEDDDEIQKYLSDELCDMYKVEQCKNGKEAFSYLLQNSVDLLISDVMMPEMDGITLCRKIKQHINMNYIPVILLTAKVSEESNLEGLNVGADAYITKPFSMEIVRKTIENLIKGRERLKNTYEGNQDQKDKIVNIDLQSPDERLLERVMEEINKNIGNPEFSVEMLAQKVGVSRVHLHRKLKEMTNQTTKDLIRNVRLKQAVVLMRNSHHNISEVALAVGYMSLASFSTVFKEFYGVSPRDYKEK